MASSESTDEPTIDILKFVAKWSELLSDGELGGVSSEEAGTFMRKHMSLEPDVMCELMTVCSPDTLTCNQELEKNEVQLLGHIPEGDIQLKALQFQAEELKKRKKDPIYKMKISQQFKYLLRKGPWMQNELSQNTQSEYLLRPENGHAVITVEVYRPFHKNRKLTMDSELQVLGDQNLGMLRDHIACLSDEKVCGDYSSAPNVYVQTKAKDQFKSAYFFIEGMFYNDLRDVSSQDNSYVIKEWARKEGIGYYGAKDMEDTRFLDLTVKLGKPYLYVHQGTCEHLMVFSDVRMLHIEDCLDYQQYPIITAHRRIKNICCRVCKVNTATWVTRGSELVPEDPCFYCDSCFQSFHYDLKGNKLFEFRAYHFPAFD